MKNDKGNASNPVYAIRIARGPDLVGVTVKPPNNFRQKMLQRIDLILPHLGLDIADECSETPDILVDELAHIEEVAMIDDLPALG